MKPRNFVKAHMHKSCRSSIEEPSREKLIQETIDEEAFAEQNEQCLNCVGCSSINIDDELEM